MVGTGTFGSVYKVINSLNGRTVCLKILPKSNVKAMKHTRHIVYEYEVLKLLSNYTDEMPSLIKLYSTFQDETNLYFELEYVPGCTLFSQIKDKSHTLISQNYPFYSLEILFTLKFLHSKSIVYRDLKPENVIIGKNGHIKLVDYGFAKIL